MGLTFTARDIAGYQGKEVELWVKRSDVCTGPNEADQTLYQIRGAQNFNPTEEKAESRVSELGFEATKVIYGTSTFSVATELLIRDLVNIARMTGLDPTSTGRISVSEFKPINCLNWIRDPDSTTIFATVYVGGFKARTCSKSLAVEANATITLDGSADLVATVDGKANIREHEGDGTCTLFAIEAGVTAGDIYLVEYPAGKILTTYDGYTFVVSGIGGVPSLSFTTAPVDAAKVRIIYEYQG